MKIIRNKRRLLLVSTIGAGLVLAQAQLAHAAQSATAPSHKTHKRTARKTTPVAARNQATTAPAASAAPLVRPDAQGAGVRSVSASGDMFAPVSGRGARGGSENIVVTGSALSTSNNANANPVQIVTSKQILQTGATTVGDYLQRLPSVGSSGTYNSQTNGTGGSSCVDLRNLGQNRTLVLIDGKRTTLNGNNSCVDLNTINVYQVQSIEILKDGGSELYGADAVAGVINIKMRHDLNDANITVRGGITDVGDGQTGQISGYKGWNFDHGKGNVTLFGSYMTKSGIMQRNRAWSRSVQINDPTDASDLLYGSSIPTTGKYFTDSGTYIPNASGTGYHTATSADRYNYGSQQSLTNSLQNSTLSFDAHYDVNSHFTPYANFQYSHRTSSTNLAPEPMTGSIYPSNLPSSLVIPADAPYNTFGEDVLMYKRYGEWGNRRTETATDTYTAIAGAKGEITHGWMYDLSYTYGWNQVTSQMSGVGNYAKLLQEYGLQQVDPTDSSSALVYNPSVCQASAGCVLSDPFKPLSSAAAAYSNYTSHDHYYYQLRDLNLRMHNNHVATMPWKGGGDLGFALGMEHRGEQLAYHPDAVVASGDTLTNSASYTGGGFNVTEGYLEGKATLLRDVFLAKDLTIDAQGRYSSYSTFGGTKNWKASINWAPIRDIRFRATIGSSYRQPNVYELYSGGSLGYASATDPCAQASSYGSLSANVVANCAKQGINTSTFVAANSGQVPTLYGGNASLKPETGRTYTIGTVITPRWVPGLSASVEYWHYTIKNMISYLSSQYILDQCYTGASTNYCNNITRVSSTSQLNSVTDYYANIGGLRTSGIDFDLDYRIRVTPRDAVTLGNNFQQLISYLQQNEPGGQWYNYAGRLMYQSGTGQPRVRDYATVNWQHGNWGVTYMMKYTGGMVWNNGSQDLSTALGYGRYKTPGVFSHDLTIDYRLNKWTFQAGVNNLFDKQPPFVADASTNSAAGLYGDLYYGRYVFLQAGVNF